MNSAIRLECGNSLDLLKKLPDCSVDSIVTDPPYGLSFMGKKWDYDVPSTELWAECLRVLKPGGHLLAFAGARTQHRMAVRIEDAGFEIRDMIAWVYGSGFPKSLDVSKAIDKRGGNAGLTAQIGEAIKKARQLRGMSASECDRLFCGGTTNWSWFEGRPTGQRAPTPETFAKIAAHWPELAGMAEAVAAAEREVIGQVRGNLLAVAPGKNNDRSATTIDITASATPAAKQWQGWGTALKPALEPITVARKPLVGTVASNVMVHGTGALNIDASRIEDGNRWPANLIHDGSEEVDDCLDGNQRFFYCAKTSKKDRNEGLERFDVSTPGQMTDRTDGSDGLKSPRAGAGRTSGSANSHPTVKPTDLMRYLCRLVTPPGGTVLDPFMGSGSTGKAAALEGFGFIGFDLNQSYVEIAEARINHVKAGLTKDQN